MTIISTISEKSGTMTVFAYIVLSGSGRVTCCMTNFTIPMTTALRNQLVLSPGFDLLAFLQVPKTKDHNQIYPCSQLHLESPDHWNWKRGKSNVCKYIES